jgi:hypothetical protein
MAADFKVQLDGPDGLAVFEASAIVPETRRANYDPYSLVHLPTDVYSYRSTTSRSFAIQAKLVSRTVDEAAANAKILYLIRKWILPDFSESGAPPPILKLTAYRNKNINELPVVITEYGWTFDDQTDYIFDGEEPMPVIGMLNIQLTEIYSAEEITGLDWMINNVGADTVSPFGVSEVSNSNIFDFGSASKLFDGVSGGGGSGGGGGGLSSASGNSPFISDASSNPNLSRNPFVIGNAGAGAANGVLNSVISGSILIDPQSGVSGSITAQVGDAFGRGAAALTVNIPGLSGSLADDV